MAKLPSMAASAAPGMFSTMPRARSCRPRWATGRAVSHSGARTRRLCLRDFEYPFDLDRGVRRQRRDADRGTGMAALVAESRDHQVGSAVEYLRSVQEIRCRIDETAESNHPHHLVEVAERPLDLRQKVDGAAARGGVALFDADTGAKFAFGDQLAVRAEADLARNKQQIA